MANKTINWWSIDELTPRELNSVVGALLQHLQLSVEVCQPEEGPLTYEVVKNEK